jgi:hypothetical protein
LLYLPAKPVAFDMATDILQRPATLVQLQSRDVDGLNHLGNAMHRLVSWVPCQSVINTVCAACHPLDPVAHLFVHRVLSELISGRRPSVFGVGAAMRLSPRTLERRFVRIGLPAPKRLLDLVTMELVARSADYSGASAAKVGRSFGLTSNDLYRLRKRKREGDRTLDHFGRLPTDSPTITPRAMRAIA